MSTASGRAHLGLYGVLATLFSFFFRRFFLIVTTLYFSSLLEALGLFFSGFLVAVSSKLSVGMNFYLNSNYP